VLPFGRVTMKETKRYNRRGFSLLEALLSIALLFMAIGTFMTLLPYALQKNQHDSYYLQAVAAGQQYLDSLRGAAEANTAQPTPPVVGIDAGFSVVDYYNKTPNQSPGTFNITGACATPAPGSTLRDCNVTVQWTETSQIRTYTTESFATQQVP
jgi:type II secretory pathway pseudopilin PulG